MVRFAHIAWVLGIACIALAGLAVGSPLALGAAAALLVVPLLGLVAVRVAAKRVEARIETPSVGAKGAPLACALVVGNGSLVPLVRVEVMLRAANLLTGQVEQVPLRCSVAPRSTVRVPVDLSSSVCGRVECSIARVSCYEPFGLFRRSMAGTGQRGTSVMPTLYDVALSNTLTAAPLSDTTVFSQFRKGADLSEPFGLRDYAPGDDLRTIHWKLTEKLDQVVVRDPALPLDNSLLVFWDKSLYGRSADPERADAMAEVVLAVCQRLIADGVLFEVAANDVRTGRCDRFFVTDENDLYELIGHLMSTPVAESGEDGLDSYRRLNGSFGCSRVIFVGAAVTDGLEALRPGRDVTAFVCDDTEGLATEPGFAEVHFAAGDAQSALVLAGVV